MNKICPFQRTAFRKTKLRKQMLLKIGAMMAVVPFLCLLLAIPTLGQRTSGQISGSVVDQNGAAVPEVTVTAVQVGTNVERTVTSSDDGLYTITDLAIGTYRLTVTKSGFKSSITENVVVNVATTTRQDTTLEVGSVDQQVTVSADAIQVETQTGAIGEVINGEQVREAWDGRARWQVFTFDRPVKAVSAQVDPERVLLLDTNYTNNSREMEPAAEEAATKWSLRWMVWLQDLMMTYAFFV